MGRSAAMPINNDRWAADQPRDMDEDDEATCGKEDDVAPIHRPGLSSSLLTYSLEQQNLISPWCQLLLLSTYYLFFFCIIILLQNFGPVRQISLKLTQSWMIPLIFQCAHTKGIFEAIRQRRAWQGTHIYRAKTGSANCLKWLTTWVIVDLPI